MHTLFVALGMPGGHRGVGQPPLSRVQGRDPLTNVLGRFIRCHMGDRGSQGVIYSEYICVCMNLDILFDPKHMKID